MRSGVGGCGNLEFVEFPQVRFQKGFRQNETRKTHFFQGLEQDFYSPKFLSNFLTVKVSDQKGSI